MSGIIGHTMYAILAAKAAAARKLPVAPVIHRHFSSYLAGSYLGCDVQTLPAATCVDTGLDVGYCTSRIEKSPITGGKVRPWTLPFEGRKIAPLEVHETFYGRAHLILGWTKKDEDLKIPLSRLVEYGANVAGDTIELFGPGERPLAWVLGWLTHVAGDGLIKSVLDGINLNLLGGKYTAKNRPVQDLVTFHEIGVAELGLNWAGLLKDLVETPVEPAQIHYMRCGERQGKLGAHFETGWRPDLAGLLRLVLAENHRYQGLRNDRLIEQLALTRLPDGTRQCDPELSRTAGGLSYAEMVEAAEAAHFRHALWQMGEIIADFFEKVIEEETLLQELPGAEPPDWETLTRRWG